MFLSWMAQLYSCKQGLVFIILFQLTFKLNWVTVGFTSVGFFCSLHHQIQSTVMFFCYSLQGEWLSAQLPLLSLSCRACWHLLDMATLFSSGLGRVTTVSLDFCCSGEGGEARKGLGWGEDKEIYSKKVEPENGRETAKPCRAASITSPN